MYYTCSGQVLGGSGSACSPTPLWGPNTLLAACLAMGCRAPTAGVCGERSLVWEQGRGAALAPLLDHNCSASQRSQTSAVHRHDPTERRASWRTSENTLFHRKIPFRHLLFLILIAEFHVEKFLTAHAVSSARAAFLRPAPQGMPEMFFFLK